MDIITLEVQEHRSMASLMLTITNLPSIVRKDGRGSILALVIPGSNARELDGDCGQKDTLSSGTKNPYLRPRYVPGS